jgi:hypothetical protein
MARSRGAGQKREGPFGTAPGKAWPLLFSASSHPPRVHSESEAGGDAGGFVGACVGRETPPVQRELR